MDDVQQEQAEAELIRELQDLIDRFGLDPVLQELKKYFPQIDFTSFLDDESDSGALPLQELRNPVRTVRDLAAGGVSVAKNLFGKLKGLFAAGAGALTVGATNLATRAVGKTVDQDVNIAGIDNDIVLKVTNPALEDLMAKTNELLALMATQAADDLEALDLSIDHVAAGLTGDSVRDIQGQQATGMVQRTDARITDDPNAGEEEDEEQEESPLPAPKSSLRKASQ